LQHFAHVFYDSACWRSDKADDFGDFWNRFFPLIAEPSCCRKFLKQFCECLLQGALSFLGN